MNSSFEQDVSAAIQIHTERISKLENHLSGVIFALYEVIDLAKKIDPGATERKLRELRLLNQEF